MAFERIDVANLALNWLGEEPIISFEDGSQASNTMDLNYEFARDATLEAHEWTFAIVRFIPGKNSTGPVWGGGNYFDVPSNIIRVLGVWDTEGNVTESGLSLSNPFDSHEQANWLLEKDKILADVDAVYCKGIERVTEEGRYSPLFVHALAAKLALVTALALTQNEVLFEKMAALYAAMIKEAKSRDGMQGRSKRIRQRGIVEIR